MIWLFCFYFLLLHVFSFPDNPQAQPCTPLGALPPTPVWGSSPQILLWRPVPLILGAATAVLEQFSIRQTLPPTVTFVTSQQSDILHCLRFMDFSGLTVEFDSIWRYDE